MIDDLIMTIIPNKINYLNDLNLYSAYFGAKMYTDGKNEIRSEDFVLSYGNYANFRC